MPSPRNHLLYIDDMREAAADIADYLDGYDYERFLTDKKTIDAVLRKFEIIGEASGRVPRDVQNLAPQIDWRGIKAFRNVVVHFYKGIDLEMVWKLAHGPLPELRVALDAFKVFLTK
jgi:uncharacterized protein with HEPN domain